MNTAIEHRTDRRQAGARPTRAARPVPADFEVIFVEQGRLECEAWYRARRTTINRWLDQSGKVRLIAKRAEFIAHQRALLCAASEASRARLQGYGRKPKPSLPVAAVTGPTTIDLLRAAANHLRCIRNGGWPIAQVPGAHTWLVGRVLRTSDELLAMAARKGFDASTARRHCEAA